MWKYFILENTCKRKMERELGKVGGLSDFVSNLTLMEGEGRNAGWQGSGGVKKL